MNQPQGNDLSRTVAAVQIQAPKPEVDKSRDVFTPDVIAFLTVLGPVLIALITGWFSWRAGSKKASSDAAGSIQAGFQMLIGKLQEERAELVKMVDKQAVENVALRDEVSALTKTVRSLEQKIDSILRRWRRGDPPPPEEDYESGGNR